jgi:hypothetical protein
VSEAPDSALVIHAFQEAAGVIAAQARGDHDGAATLLASFGDDATMASGFLLLAQVATNFVAEATQTPVDELLRQLVLNFEREIGGT